MDTQDNIISVPNFKEKREELEKKARVKRLEVASKKCPSKSLLKQLEESYHED